MSSVSASRDFRDRGTWGAVTLVDFTQEQRVLIEMRGSGFVEACPGAGKTQSIVERFIRRSGEENRRGIALLSFTNTAIDEVRMRCASWPELLASPSFVGTIDAFINRFIVSPVYTARTGRLTSLKESWSAVPGSLFWVNGINAIQFQLDWFTVDGNGPVELQVDRVPYSSRNAVKGLAASQVKSVLKAAKQCWCRLLERGIMDCSTARVLMVEYLNRPEYRSRVGKLLSGRFREIIVDEVQDCAKSDVYLIDFLREFGIDLVLVGDLDQAIYEFRGSDVGEIRELTQQLPPGVRLDGNFRSSRTICTLNDSLRYGDSVDKAVGRFKDGNHKIGLIRSNDLNRLHQAVVSACESADICEDEVVVLSRYEKFARSCAGAPKQMPASSNKLVGLARAACAVQDSRTSARRRSQARASFASILRSFAPQETYVMSEAAFCDHVGLQERQFREGCVRLSCRSSPLTRTPAQFREEICLAVKELGWDWAAVNTLRSPPRNVWPAEMSASEARFRFSTIHGFKGLQAAAVVLVIPKPHAGHESGVEAWSELVESEARRVLYVGASRAQKLLVIAADDSQFNRVKQCLERDGVPFDLL